MHGHELFSAEEAQTRRQIWWACILTDRYGSVYMGMVFTILRVLCRLTTVPGRPVMIKDEDFDTPLPNVDPVSCFSKLRLISMRLIDFS